MGTIPSRAIKILKKRILDLSSPGEEPNANKMHRENYTFQKKKERK